MSGKKTETRRERNIYLCLQRLLGHLERLQLGQDLRQYCFRGWHSFLRCIRSNDP